MSRENKYFGIHVHWSLRSFEMVYRKSEREK